LLRAGRQSEGRRRRRRRAPGERIRRRRGGTDREADHAGDPGREVEIEKPAMSVHNDEIFDGRYKVVRKLGAGGMADVYLAEDQELGRRVAIKILNGRHANDAQFIERFRREAKNAAALNHPSIVSIYDRGEAEDTYYIPMEYLDGRTLKELVVGRGPAP